MKTTQIILQNGSIEYLKAFFNNKESNNKILNEIKTIDSKNLYPINAYYTKEVVINNDLFNFIALLNKYINNPYIKYILDKEIFNKNYLLDETPNSDIVKKQIK